MTSGHIAHNCKIGNDTVICSCALVAGHVEIERPGFRLRRRGDSPILEDPVGLAMISGNTRVNLDAPPFFLYSGFNVAPRGLNLVGLNRAGFDLRQVAALKKAYRLLYRFGLGLEEALQRIEVETPTEHTLHLVRFIRSSKRGICRIKSGSALRED